MKKKSGHEAMSLRQRAEYLLNTSATDPLGGRGKNMSGAKNVGQPFGPSDDAVKVVHELEVHKIELEIQNEELVQSNEEVRLVAQKYAEQYDFAPLGYFTLSKDGKIKELNLNASLMLGKGRSNLKNKSIISFVSAETKPIFNHFLDKIFCGQAKETCEIALAIEGKLPIYAHLVGTTTENGEQCFVTAIDITERIHAETILRESEDRYKSLFQGNYSVMLLVDPASGEIRDANPAACKFYGWTHSEMCRKHISEINRLTPGELKVGLIRAKEEKQNHFFFNHRLANGEIRDVEVYTGPIVFGDSTLLYSLVHDITERKLAENALRETNQKWEAIIAASPDGIGIVSMDSKLQLMSDKLLKMFGYAVEERANYIGHTVFDFIDPSDHEKMRDNIRKLLSNELDQNVTEYLAVRKDKSIFYVESNSTVLRDPQGNLTGILYVQRDISQRKLAESLRDQQLVFTNALNKIAEVVILKDNAEEILESMNRIIGETLQLDRALIYDISFEKGHITGLCEWLREDHPDIAPTKGVYPINLFISPLTEIKNTHKHIDSQFDSVNPCFTRDGSGDILHGQMKIKSLLWYPFNFDRHGFYLFTLNQILGKRSWTPEEFVFLGSVTKQVSLALTKIRLVEERKNKEEQLKESEERYRFMFANNPQPMWIADLETLAFLEVNQAAIGHYGYSKGEFLSMTIRDIRPVEDVPVLLADLELFNLGKRDNSAKTEWRHIKKNGELIFVEILTHPMVFNGRKAQHILVTDITERKKAEIEASDKKTLLTNLIINLQEGILLEGPNRNILLTNQLFCDMFAIPAPPEALIGADCSNAAEQSKLMFRNPDKFIADLVIILADRAAVFNDELELTDGRYFERDYIPTYLNGEYSGHLWKYRDITKRKHAELKLAKSELRFRQVVEQSQEVVWEVDAQGLYTYLSPLSKKVYGYDPEQMIGNLYFYDLHPDDKREQYKKAAFEVFREKGNFFNLVGTMVRPDGAEVIIKTNGIPILGEDGGLLGYRGIDVDITERILAEQKILELNTNLDIKIEQRTDQLSEANYLLELEVDERVKATAIAEEALGRLRNIASRLPGTVYEYRLRPDGTSCFPYASDGIKNIYRVGPEEVCDDASPVFTKLHPDDFEGVVASIRASARDLTAWQHEYRVKFDDGTVRWLSGNAMPQRETDGTVLWHGFISDITERKEREDELNRVSTRLALATQSSGVGVWDYDIVNNVLVWDDQMFALYGIKKDDFSGVYEAWQAGLHPDDKARGDKDIQKAISGEEEFDTEFRVVWPDGTVRNIRAFAIVQRDNEGKPLKLVGTNWDITRQKRAENALRMSEAKHSSMIANISDVIAIMGTDGYIKYKSPNIEKYFGWQPCDLVGTDGWSTVHPDDLDRIQSEFYGLLQNDNFSKTVEYKYKCKDGSYKPIELTATNLVNDNTINGILLNYHDITERKWAEEFEDELLQLSLQLTGIPVSEIDSALDIALSKIGRFLGADRAYIFEMDTEKNTMSNTFEWCNDGIGPEIENLQDIPCDILPMWVEKLRKNENIIIPSVPDLPVSWSTEREILEPQGIQSLIVIPMSLDYEMIGFVGLDSVLKKRQYTAAEINILKVWGNLLASLINHKKRERIIEQTRINYETFFNTIDDFLFVLDVTGNMIYTNTTVTRRLEYSTEELMSKSVLMVHPPERREEAGRIVGEMLAGTADFCPVPLVTKSGKFIPVETRVKSGFWDGHPVIFGVTKDVSKIKLSEEKFSKAFHFNSSLMAITGYDNGIFIDVNETLLRTLGYSREEMVGKPSSDFNLFDDPGLRGTVVGKLKQNIPVREIEMMVRAKSGSPIIGLFSADIIYIGKDLCLLTMIVDITERKNAEEDLKKARYEADMANLAKSEFLSRMSHELRTPMNSILGFAQLLQMGDLNPRQNTAIGHILNSGKHLLDLINEVLNIAQIESGKISLSLEPVKLSSIIPEMMDLVHPYILKERQSLELIDSPANQLYVVADNQRLRQVLLNLINNAIKYNRTNGSVSIKAELRPSSGDGAPYVRVSITDTGLGIAARDIPKLFKPFERIGAEKSGIEGTGLGLSVVKKIMDAMAGIVGVESVLGLGSTFWVELPQSATPLECDENGDTLSVTTPVAAEKTGTILYVEDNVPNIELVEQILSDQRPDIRLVYTKNGGSAVSMATANMPGLILLDLDLPDIHGTEVLRLLKEEAATNKIPVIVISADAMPKQIEKLIKAGAVNYLTKPFDIEAFLSVVDEWIG